jgi:phage-related holin
LIENAAHLGLPIPEKMKEVLEQLHNRDEKGTDDKEEK